MAIKYLSNDVDMFICQVPAGSFYLCALDDTNKQAVLGEKCGLPAFSPFPTMFSKGFFLKGVKSWDCVVKGKWLAVIPTK